MRPTVPALRFALAALAASLAIGLGASQAQAPGTFGIPGAGTGAVAVPRFDPEGVWGEVVSITPKWVVVQDQQGRQFPISLGMTERFVVRWPINQALLSNGAWAEVTGIDLGSNQVSAAHVDIYEGAARSMVTPVSVTLVGFNRVLDTMQTYQMNTFGLFQPMAPIETLMPRRRHVVGPVVGVDPLLVGVQGANPAMVVPGTEGTSMTQVTIGSSNVVKPGDLVWFAPFDASPATLAVSQLVVYKAMPLRAFVP